MTTSTRISFNLPGFNDFRRSPEVQAALLSMGKAIAEAAGGEDDFQVIPELTKSRARVIVITATPAAREAEATRQALTRALDAARG